MTSPRRRIAVAAAIVVVVVVVASIAVGVISGGGTRSPQQAGTSTSTAGSTGGGSSVPDTTETTQSSATPTAADVAAARACEAFEVYVEAASRGSIPKAVGARLANTAGALLKGERNDQRAGRSLPKWAQLGSELLAAASDIVNGNGKALKTDGAAADRSCATISAAAARAGGYKRSG